MLIPLLFMGDVVGRLFREFAVTLAITILISAVVSLTLVPMMSARWLKPRDEAAEEPKHGLGARLRGYFEGVIDRYDRALAWVIDHEALTLLVAVATLVLTVLLYLVHPEGPVPDPGHRPAAGARRRPPTTSRTRAWPSCSRRRRARCCEDPAVENVSSFIGVDAANNTMLHTGRMLIDLKPRPRRRRPR